MSDTPKQNSDDQPNDAKSNIGAVIDQLIERELHDSYLTYAMSTIMDRALPDVRDGLKPSQRRILVAMHDLNLSPGKKHRKCAKIAGDTSGNYHPHGESVIYPTLVNMGQDWKMRVTLIDKQGNFGSIDGDPPAAMRYTEARMTHAAVAMLDDIKLDTVDFKPNYDETNREVNELMGWISADNTLSQLKFSFDSKEEAVEFCESKNFEYEIFEPKQSSFKLKSYTENFTK